MNDLRRYEDRAVSPFDEIKREDADGEHWSGRDLMRPLGYSKWQQFNSVIERAQAACLNSGADVTSNFTGARKISATRPGGDYRLTRYGAYLVAMNGDPRKPEIAAAQTYFAVKTREAEVAPRPASQLDILAATVAELQRIDREAAATAEAVRSVEDRVDALEGNHGWHSALGYAKRRGWNTDTKSLNSLGRRARQIGRTADVEPAKVPHPTFGEVNAWPEWVWDQAHQDGAGAD